MGAPTTEQRIKEMMETETYQQNIKVVPADDSPTILSTFTGGDTLMVAVVLICVVILVVLAIKKPYNGHAV